MQSNDGDRDLDLGFLAWSLGLLGRDDLRGALCAWSEGRSGSLEQIFRESGLLSQEEIVHLRSLLDQSTPLDNLRATEWRRARFEAGLSDSTAIELVEGKGPQAGSHTVSVDLTTNDTLALPDSDESEPTEPGPQVVGMATTSGNRFQILQPHAKGGLGLISIALDLELGRLVALKEIQERHAGNLNRRARFIEEAKITGRLQHPGIIPIHALGAFPDGRPFYAMRFIKGNCLMVAIERFHDPDRPTRPSQRRLELRELLGRYLAVCDAMAYAHSRGVLHRDLKPANILLGPFGETLIVDWGLAKSMNEPKSNPSKPVGPFDSSASPIHVDSDAARCDTVAGLAIGTPSYMSPEQGGGQVDQIGPATDVYGLGATLYTLLTGQPPADDPDPKVVVAKVRAGEIPPPRAIDPSIPRSLEAICVKAMALRPEDRYESVLALADDLKRWLADEQVKAFHESWTDRMVRWGRRRKPWLGGAAAALLISLVSTLLIHDAWRDIEAARNHARTADIALRTAQRGARMQSYYAMVNHARERAAILSPGWTWDVLEELRAALEVRAEAIQLGPSSAEADAQFQRECIGLRSLAARALATFDFRPEPDLDPGLNPACLVFSPDGRTLALGQFKAQAFISCWVALMDWETKRVKQQLQFPPAARFQFRRGAQDGARWIDFSPDGTRLAVGARSGMVHCWDLSNDAPPRASWNVFDGGITGLSFGADATTLYTGDDEGRLKLWRITGLAEQLEVEEEYVVELDAPIRHLNFHPTGGLAVLTEGGVTRLDPKSLSPLGAPLALDAVHNRLAFSPDGRLLAIGSADAITLVHAETGAVLRRLIDPDLESAHRGGLCSLVFQPGGSILASSCSDDDDRRVKFWDVATGRLLGSHFDGAGAGYSLLEAAFHPDSRRLVATGQNRVAAYELANHEVLEMLPADVAPARALAIAPDGETLARLGRRSATLDVGLWSLDDRVRREGVEVALDHPGSRGEFGLTFNPRGDILAFHGQDSNVMVWSPTSAESTRVLPIDRPGSLQFADDGHALWGRFDDGGAIGCWAIDRDSSEPSLHWSDQRARILRGLGSLYSLAIVESRVLAGGRDGHTRLLQRQGETLELVYEWDHQAGPVQALALSPDAKLCVVGTQQGRLALLALDQPSEAPMELEAHTDAVTVLAFSPHGRWFASGSHDSTVRLWHVAGKHAHEVATLRAATGAILDLVFHPDRERLFVAVDGEHSPRVWHLDCLSRRWSDLGLGLDNRTQGSGSAEPCSECAIQD